MSSRIKPKRHSHRAIVAALCASIATTATLVVAPRLGHGFHLSRPAKSINAADQLVAELPLTFEANRGQTDSAVSFLARGTASTLFVTPKESVVVLGHGRGALRMRLDGANPSPVMEGLDRQTGVVNQFRGSDPAGWQESVPTFAKAATREVYPGIDMVWHGTRGALEYDFVLSPGADPDLIALSFAGASDLGLDGEDLVATVGESQVRHRAPLAYQDIAGSRRAVDSAYVLDTDGTVRFRLGGYDPTKPLVIDPLVVSQFRGGTGGETTHDMAVDASGNVYVTGVTSSTDFPVLNNIDDNDSQDDVFVYKLSASGAVVYSTYLSSGTASGAALGASRHDEGRGIAVDDTGNAYVTGFTDGGSFPTTVGAFDADRPYLDIGNSTGTTTYTTSTPVFSANDVGRVISGENIPANTRISAFVSSTEVTISAATTATASALDFTIRGHTSRQAFVTKLSANGSLSGGFSTWLGGNSAGEEAWAIAVNDGYAYVAGVTDSTDFPTMNPIQADQPGQDAFVTKVNQAGSGLVWSTYLGADGTAERAFDVAVDNSGAAYVSGATNSTTFPTVNAFQNVLLGSEDAFLAKVNSAGNAFAYSTYLGGSGSEFTNETIEVAVDNSNHAYIAGQSSSTDFPTTPGAFQTEAPPSTNAFVAKLDTGATGAASLAYSTYVGGNSTDAAAKMGLAIDGSGNAYVSGGTSSTDFPTASPVQKGLAGSNDGFVVKLNATGSGLVWSTYLGGTAFDGANAVHLDPSGALYVAGTSASINFPHPPGEASPVRIGGNDAFVARFTRGHAPRPVDFKADGYADESVYRPSTGHWFVEGGLTTVFGTTGDVPVPGDYDGDGDADVAVYRPSTGHWFVQGGLTTTWGASADVPVPGDYDGDGQTGVAVYRPSSGEWYLKGGSTPVFGASGDVPAPADYDRDGTIDVAVYRPSTGLWFTEKGAATAWGSPGDVSLVLPYAVRSVYFP
ncbi:MAG: SBBP repeat-containing protein [Acidimicrobiales bacterium]